MRTLEDFCRSKYFQMWESDFLGNDLWINDPDIAERIHEASEYGCDGRTHAEVIQCWRDALADYARDHNLDDRIRSSIEKEIDECEEWHINNGSIDDEI